jgi:hypothetical protein
MARSLMKASDPANASGFAKYLAVQIENSGMTQRQIAEALEYPKPNIITMFKQGLTKVPIEKIPALAGVLGLDPRHLLIRAMREYMPKTLRTIEATLGHSVSEREYEIVAFIREMTDDAVPPLTNELKNKLKHAFALRPDRNAAAQRHPGRQRSERGAQ